MPALGLETEIVDHEVYARTVRRFREARIVLPTFAQLAAPATIPQAVDEQLAGVDRDELHPLNLFRVHWHNEAHWHNGAAHNGTRGGKVAVPEHLVLPPSLTGVEARIVVVLGQPFPMIRAHKVLAAYGCLAPRIITGQFDPTSHRAVWPSTGNYCRGGLAISRIMGCRGVAVLPEGMSRERFAWLEERVVEPADIIRTTGSESNVKEIYDRCALLSRDPANIIFNQFSEMANYLVHWACTGRALATVFEDLAGRQPNLRLRAYFAATGSAGTLGAGDYLKQRYGSLIGTAEALECPTLLYGGFGEHNIQGIGDKHVPLIHNVMNTDLLAGISDASTDSLLHLFNTEEGRHYLLQRRDVPPAVVDRLGALGFSAICNVLAAIKAAKYFAWGPEDVVVTVATDGEELYRTEHEKILARRFPRGFDAVAAGETFGQHLLGVATDHFRELDIRERTRIFNLGYFTWVEQQGIDLADFEARRRPEFWSSLHDLVPAWDELIVRFNRKTGLGS